MDFLFLHKYHNLIIETIITHIKINIYEKLSIRFQSKLITVMSTRFNFGQSLAKMIIHSHINVQRLMELYRINNII